MVLIRSIDEIKNLVKQIPENWLDYKESYIDVLFLNDKMSGTFIQKRFCLNAVDGVLYSKQTIIWKVERKDVNKSTLQKIARTKVYKQFSLKNTNTVKKTMT